MKVTQISISGRLPSDGSRLISALIKNAGHQVTNIYLSRIEPDYSKQEFTALDQVLINSQLVLIAVYSNYAGRAKKLTEYIHETFPGLMVIWGGPHCISAPELSLNYADGVCFSEGDQSVVEFVEKVDKGLPYYDTPNMAFLKNGSIIKNKVLPPFTDLDDLPYYDFSLDEQYLLNGGLVPLTKSMVASLLKLYPFYVPTLFFLSSRGCTQLCSFCNNCRFVSLFGHNKIRFYSVDRVIDELSFLLQGLDFIEFIGFGDDDFFARPLSMIEEFADKYKQKIDLPFAIAVSPRTYRQDKLSFLLESGLKAINIGIQSGSQRVLDEVYNRKLCLKKTKSIINEIASYKENYGLEAVVDIIIDNPYETKDDIKKTFWYLLELPPQINLNLFFLSFYPGTPIYQRALEDGFIEAFDDKQSRPFSRSSLRYQINYETILLQAIRRWRFGCEPSRITDLVFRFFGSNPICKVMSLIPHTILLSVSNSLRLNKAPWRFKKN